jgi:hypothetical protein
MPINKLREDMCNLEPQLPLIRLEWRERKYDAEKKEWVVTAMCPLCSLAVNKGLVTLDQINQDNIEIGDWIRDAIVEKYDLDTEAVSVFVDKWDSSSDIPLTGLDTDRACRMIDKVIESIEAEEVDNNDGDDY